MLKLISIDINDYNHWQWHQKLVQDHKLKLNKSACGHYHEQYNDE